MTASNAFRQIPEHLRESCRKAYFEWKRACPGENHSVVSFVAGYLSHARSAGNQDRFVIDFLTRSNIADLLSNHGPDFENIEPDDPRLTDEFCHRFALSWGAATSDDIERDGAELGVMEAYAEELKNTPLLK